MTSSHYIADRILLASKLINSIKSFVDNMFELLNKVDIATNTMINKNIHGIDTSIITAKSAPYSSIEELANLYTIFYTIDTQLFHISESLESIYPKIDHLTQTSGSGYVSFNKQKAKVIEAVAEYNVYISKDNSVFSEYINNISAQELFEFVTKYNGPHINKFIAHIISVIIKDNSISAADKARLKSYVDKYIDTLLDVKRSNLEEPGIMSILLRYNLLPARPAMPLRDLFSYITANYDASLSDHDNLAKLAVGNVGVIIINLASSTNIDFDYDGLINLDFIKKHGYDVPPTMGLNKKIINKYNTISLRKSNMVYQSVKILPTDKSRTQWRVILTQDNQNYSLMTYLGQTIIQTEYIYGIIYGITDRATNYGTLQFDKISKVYTDQNLKYAIKKYEGLQHTKYNSAIIKNIVFDKISKQVADLILSANYTHEEIEKLCKDADIINKNVTDAIINTQRLKYDNIELLTTHLSKINDAAYLLSLELNKSWRSNKIPNKYTIENVLKHCDANLKKAIDEVDRVGGWEMQDISFKDFLFTKKI